MPCVQTDLLFTPVAQIITVNTGHIVNWQRRWWECISLAPYCSSSRATVKSELYISVHQADSQEVSAAGIVTVQQGPVGHQRPKCQLKLHKGQITLRGLRPLDDSIWERSFIKERWGKWETWRVGERKGGRFEKKALRWKIMKMERKRRKRKWLILQSSNCLYMRNN